MHKGQYDGEEIPTFRTYQRNPKNIQPLSVGPVLNRVPDEKRIKSTTEAQQSLQEIASKIGIRTFGSMEWRLPVVMRRRKRASAVSRQPWIEIQATRHPSISRSCNSVTLLNSSDQDIRAPTAAVGIEFLRDM